MADLSRTVEVIFQGTDSVSDSLNGISQKMNKFGDDIGNIGAPFADAADKVALFTTAVAGIAIAGVTASAGIESEAKKMQNSLGLPTAEAERFKEIALEVYTGGYGDDMVAAFGAVTDAQKRFGDNAAVDIGKVTEQALVLQKTFGIDYNEALSAASSLMKNFGLDSKDAFDFIVTGFQNGLNGSDDFIDSITEYAIQFKSGGADADAFFSILKTGFQDGIAGTDYAADMFAEFGKRIQDGSKTTSDALKSIGIDPDALANNFASGEATVVDTFNLVQAKLNETEDKNVQFQASVALMGTRFEDLGRDAALAINTTNTKLSEMQGAIDRIDTKSFSESFLSAIRTITTEFGDLKQWDDAKGKIKAVFGGIAESFGPALAGVDFGPLEDKVGELWDKVSSVFSDNDIDLTSVDGMQNAIQLVIDSVSTLTDVLSGMADVFGSVFGVLKTAAETINDMPEGVKEFAGQVIALGTALTGVAGVVATGSALMGGLGSLVGLFSSGGALATGIAAIVTILTGPAGLAIALGTVATAVAGYTMGNIEAEHETAIASIEKETEKIRDLTDEINDLPTGISTVDIYAAVEAGELETAMGMLDDIKNSDEYKARIQADTNSFDSDLAELREDLANLPCVVDVAANEDSIAETRSEIITVGKRADGTPITIEIPITTEADKAKKEIAEIPSEKEIEIKLQGDIDKQIAQITAAADVAKSAFEWSAKVDIAEAESAAIQVKSAFESVEGSVSSLSGSVSSMFGKLVDQWNNLDPLAQRKLMKELEKQDALQANMVNKQIELVDAQINLMDKRSKALENADGLIKIDGTGLEPALDMIMWQIIEKVQIKASEEAAGFLLGI